MNQSTAAPHPAKFSDSLLPVIAGYLKGYRVVLDPMAGVGTLARYLNPLGHAVWSNELELEWARQCPHPAYIFDARHMYEFDDGMFDGIATSPTYGNRMADHHEAKERCRACGGSGKRHLDPEYESRFDPDCVKCGGSGRRQHKRHTYRHYIGRPLTPGNTGQMQWGQEYRDTHQAIIAECVRVLRAGGRVVWNVKDHYKTLKKGEAPVLQEVVEWHRHALAAAGLEFVGGEPVPCPGQRHGQNGQVRVDHEWVLVFDKPRNA